MSSTEKKVSKKKLRDFEEPDAELDPDDRYVLRHIPKAYDDGVVLKRWWEKTYARDSFRQKFQLVRQLNQPSESFGFLDSVLLDGSQVPIGGEYQHDFFDQPKAPADVSLANEWIKAQLRIFALRYFLRVSALHATTAFPQRIGPRADPLFPFLSACSKLEDERQDIGFTQLAYKLEGDDDEIHAFPKSEQSAFVDVREIGEKYAWVLAKARIFQFQLTFYPFGEKFFPVTFADPNEYLYLLFTPYFVSVEEPEEKRAERRPDGRDVGLLAEYGFGFSIVANPSSKDVFTEGPQVFTTGIQFFKFQLWEDGQIWVRMVFLANQLTHIFQFPLDPLYWTFKLGELTAAATKSSLLPFFQGAVDRLPLGPTIDPVFGSIRLLNAVTGGLAGRDYCISIDEVQRDVLVKHEEVFSEMISDAGRTWRQIRDWLDTDALPVWVRRGVQ